jgi:hypothetical protein
MANTFHGFFANPQQRYEFYVAVVQKAQKAPSKKVWHSLKELGDGLKDRCTEWPPIILCPLLISIDEVHVLYTHRAVDEGSDYTLYSRMKSVLNEGVSYNFGVISLSTVSHILSLSPSKETVSSMRERDDRRILPAPFTELSFDVYVIDNPLAPDRLTLSSVGSLEFTAKFGRPL